MENLVRWDVSGFELAQGSAQTAALYLVLARTRLIELVGQPAPLAVVGLRKVDQLKVEAEGAGQLICRQRVIGVLVDAEERLLELAARSGLGVAGLLRFPAADGSAAKLFHRVEERRAGLLAQHITKQHTQRADIAPERSFLQFTLGSL